MLTVLLIFHEGTLQSLYEKLISQWVFFFQLSLPRLSIR